MTPTQHRAAAEDLLEQHAGGRTHDHLLTLRMYAHASLATAAGTGASYAASNLLLEQVSNRPAAPVDPAAIAMTERALAHAQMVDR